MKRAVTILGAAAICLATEMDSFSFTKQYSGTNVRIENGKSEITLDSLNTSGIAGDLKLPHEIVRIVVPAGKTVNTVQVTSDTDTLKIPVPVATVPPSIVNGLEMSDGRGSVHRPSVEIVNQCRSGGVETVSLRINPVTLIDSLTTIVASKMSVTVQFVNDQQWKPSPLYSLKSIESLNPLNPDALSTYSTSARSRSGGAAEYLCITDQSMVDAIADYTIHDLIALREKQGFSTKIITTEEIESSYSGEDLQMKIREAIRDHYENSGTAYVFIAGDHNIVPARFLRTVVGSGSGERFQVASDLYYQCLDGSFNEDGDEHYGEMNSDGPAWNKMDFMPELSIGRAPAEDFVELSNFIAKTIHWESAPSSSEQYQNMLLAGEYLGFSGDMVYSKPSLEEVRYGTDKGNVTTAGIPGSMNIETLYDMDLPEGEHWGKEEIQAKINSDRFGAIAHVGHGLTSKGLHMINSDIYDMNNGFPLFFYSEACVIGRLEEKAILEDMLTATRNGFWGAIGNSGYGSVAPPSTYGPTHLLHRMFWHIAFRKENPLTRVGDIAAEMHRLTADIQLNQLSYVHYETTLWADPATPLRLGNDESEFFIITPHRKSAVQKEGKISVTWRDDIHETVSVSLITEGNSTIVLAEEISSTGTFQTVLPETVEAGEYRLVVQGSERADTSASFSVIPMEHSIEILAPVADEHLLVNEEYEIQWHGKENELVSLVLCRDNQQDIIIAEQVSGSSFNWTPAISTPRGKKYRIAVISSLNPGTSNLSEPFTIGDEVVAQFPWSESFDSFELGTTLKDHWYQGELDALQWQVHTGPTPRREQFSSSPMTGAPEDHSGNGNYLFIESDDESCMLKIGNLFSPSFDLSVVTEPKLKLWYHMYSSYNTMGALNIAIAQDGMIDTVLATKVRDQGDSWQQMEIDLSQWEGDTVQFIIQGMTGEDVNSDICIDDIEISGSGEVAIVDRPKPAQRNDVQLSVNPVPVDHSELKFYFQTEVVNFRIQIFDVTGNELFDCEGYGSEASWNLKNSRGVRVSGLCKAIVTVTENNGVVKQWHTTVGIER